MVKVLGLCKLVGESQDSLQEEYELGWENELVFLSNEILCISFDLFIHGIFIRGTICIMALVLII